MRAMLILVAILISTSSYAQDNQHEPRPHLINLQPCELPGLKDRAQCGSLEVFENRSSRKGRKLTLKVVVLPATGQTRSADPLFYIPGGPGSSAIEDAPGIATLFAKIRDRHDLVFLDQRGTGGHGFGGLEGIECVQNLMSQFVEEATTKNLGTSCVNTIRRKGFAIK